MAIRQQDTDYKADAGYGYAASNHQRAQTILLPMTAHPFTPIASWSFTATASQQEEILVDFNLHVTNACISTKSLTELNHTTLRLHHKDLSEPNPTFKEATLCWLSPTERGWSVPLNLVFSPGETIRFEVSQNAVDLVGYYFDVGHPTPASPSVSADRRSRKRPRVFESEPPSSSRDTQMIVRPSNNQGRNSTSSSGVQDHSLTRVITVEKRTIYDGASVSTAPPPSHSRASSASSIHRQRMHVETETIQQTAIQRNSG
ncbi:hypothetical protein SISSUDRAFT_1065843 [Sistotremastrum suecicum HHB10207 ss-3]|uniref:Nucleoplasmin-like domain-containing protein n=1 Tax=Sistotremastrum suecicum HHB10207 ss-3 TaxID=1314776 RepID=A0A165Z0U6_9AGAM|nr:hypothetical protein SISSUDRAFT_1065843 [Sistotremastrum suecicum HHB10207 ss-3]